MSTRTARHIHSLPPNQAACRGETGRRGRGGRNLLIRLQLLRLLRRRTGEAGAQPGCGIRERIEIDARIVRVSKDGGDIKVGDRELAAEQIAPRTDDAVEHRERRRQRVLGGLGGERIALVLRRARRG